MMFHQRIMLTALQLLNSVTRRHRNNGCGTSNGGRIVSMMQVQHNTTRTLPYDLTHCREHDRKCFHGMSLARVLLQHKTSTNERVHFSLCHKSFQRWLFVQTQATPNPDSLMFLPGVDVMDTERNDNNYGQDTNALGANSVDFASARSAMISPLAIRLFRIEGVTRVFLGSDFITVSKGEEFSWNVLKPHIFSAISDHFASGEPIINVKDSEKTSNIHIIEDDDSETVKMIKELLETRIRPAVNEDGGDIVFKKFDEDTGIVSLELQGSCSGCPSSSVTLKSGVENMLMHYVPEVKAVEQYEEEQFDHSQS